MQFRGRLCGEWNCRLAFVGLGFRAQLLAGADDGESLFVEQLLDAQNILDVAAAVHSLSGAAFHRLELREFTLPEAQHVGRQAAQRGDFSDAEIKFIRNDDDIRLVFLRSFFSWAHEFAGLVFINSTFSSIFRLDLLQDASSGFIGVAGRFTVDLVSVL